MDIRVIKTRIESALVDFSSEGDPDYLVYQLKEILQDMDNEINYSNQNIDSGRVATIVDDLRHTYNTLITEYDAMPRITRNIFQRANKLDEITITCVKICNYLAWAISKNSTSTNLEQRRSCTILQTELENYKKQFYTWTSLLNNLREDKKLVQLKRDQNSD